MKDKIINKRIIIITIALIVFLLVLKDIFQYQVTSYDNWAYDVFVEGLRSKNMTLIMQLITSFGNLLIIGTIVVILFLFYKNRKMIYLLMINTLSIIIINSFIKLIIQRPRPDGYRLISESNFSFPSAHSMISTVFYGFLIYIIYNEIKNKKIKYLLIFILSILIVLICISRIYLGVHYLSDTIAGFALSIIYLMIITALNSEYNKEVKHERKRRKKEKKEN